MDKTTKETQFEIPDNFKEFLNVQAENIIQSRCLDTNGLLKVCQLSLEMAYLKGSKDGYKEACEDFKQKIGGANGTTVKDKRGS